MSILQDYEQIRNEMGKEKFATIEEYLNLNPDVLLSDIYYKKDCYDTYAAWRDANYPQFRTKPTSI